MTPESVFEFFLLEQEMKLWLIPILLLSSLCPNSVNAEDQLPGKIITVAGNGVDGFDGDGGLAREAAISQPFGVVVGPKGHLYVCQVGSHVIRKVDRKSDTISTICGTGELGRSPDGTPAVKARIHEPYEVRFASNGDLYFVQMKGHTISRIDASSGQLFHIGGTGEPGFSGDGGPAVNAQFHRPHSIILDGDDHVYICDIGNHRIRKIDSITHQVSTLSGTGEKKRLLGGAAISGAALMGPRALDIESTGNLILALREGNSIYRMDLKTQTYHLLAGTGKNGYSGDEGPAVQGQLSGPKGVAVAANGDVYFADTESHTIRVVRAATGKLQTVVGDGKRGDGPDGNPRHCRLDRPHGICLDADGNLYIGDSNNHKVRMLPLGPVGAK